MINIFNKLIINNLGRDLTEYISSNTMNIVTTKINPFIWTYDLKALVLIKYLENNEIINLTLLPNQHWKTPEKDQYINLEFFIEGKKYIQSYSILSIKDNIFTITVKKIKNDFIFDWCKNNLKKGMIFDISFSLKKTDTFPLVYFKHYNKQIQLTELDKNKSLLQLGIENGLNLEKGCKKGICGTCKLILHEGEVKGNKLGKAVYICSAFPDSDLVVLGI